jgi:hypothetical protein
VSVVRSASLGNAFAKPCEVWAIDQSNSPGKTYGGGWARAGVAGLRGAARGTRAADVAIGRRP